MNFYESIINRIEINKAKKEALTDFRNHLCNCELCKKARTELDKMVKIYDNRINKLTNG